jgi:hypothetical protein
LVIFPEHPKFHTESGLNTLLKIFSSKQILSKHIVFKFQHTANKKRTVEQKISEFFGFRLDLKLVRVCTDSWGVKRIETVEITFRPKNNETSKLKLLVFYLKTLLFHIVSLA